MVFALLLGPATDDSGGYVCLEVLATALLVGVVLAGWLLPWQRLPQWAQAVPVYLVLPAIALLRHANGGVASGYAPLAPLPVLWLALHAGRRELVLGLALLGATFRTPLLLFPDSARYPGGSWRLAVLIVLTGAVVALTTRDLTAQVRRRVGDLHVLGRVARDLPFDGTARSSVCAAARELAEATFVVMFEPDTGRRNLVATGADGIELQAVIPLDRAGSAAVTAFRSGRSSFVQDCVGSPAVDQRLAAATGAVSMLVRPVIGDGGAIGVLVIGVDRRIRAVPARLDEVLTIVAAEAALVVGRADLLSRLAHAAQTDGLTGADNRRGWELAVAQEQERGGGRPVVVALHDGGGRHRARPSAGGDAGRLHRLDRGHRLRPG